MLTTRRVRPDDGAPRVSRGEAPQPEPRVKYLRGVTRVKRVERTCRAGPVYQFVHAAREKLLVRAQALAHNPADGIPRHALSQLRR